MIVTTEQLDKAALALFANQADDWGLPPTAASVEWDLDPELRAFWRRQVMVVIKAIGGTTCAA